jgi:hypothetical protein
VAWLVDESDGRAFRLPAGPTDDDNRWPCCRHCAHEYRLVLTRWHDEPCLECHATPGPEEET